MRILLLPLLAAALLLLANGCREKKEADCFDHFNPACADYDPCLQKFRTEAEFGLFNRSVRNGVSIYLPFRDTIPISAGGGERRIFFRAADTRMDAYEWRIGQDPRVFTDSLFSLLFSNVSGWINFSLTTYNDQHDPSCFPSDSGKATVQKAYYFKPYSDFSDEGLIAQFPIFGSYLGHEEGSPQDTFRIRIEWIDLSLPSIFNLPRGCDLASTAYTSTFNTHYFLVDGTRPGLISEFCHDPKVYAVLQPDNQTLHIDYEVTRLGKRIKRKWVGVKI